MAHSDVSIRVLGIKNLFDLQKVVDEFEHPIVIRIFERVADGSLR